jgi:hypothetical protein
MSSSGLAWKRGDVSSVGTHLATITAATSTELLPL